MWFPRQRLGNLVDLVVSVSGANARARHTRRAGEVDEPVATGPHEFPSIRHQKAAGHFSLEALPPQAGKGGKQRVGGWACLGQA